MLAGSKPIHLCIDMQRLFAEQTEWHTPTLMGIVPNIVRLVEAKPAHTIFARFTVPETHKDAKGSWRPYYRRWTSLTGANLAPGMIDLVAPLAAIARGEETFDKPTYSLFSNESFLKRLAERGTDALVITGVETDICVLATVFDAVDRGYKVVLPHDAVTSSAPDAHRATLDLILSRMPEQISICSTAEMLEDWSRA